tara:strand:- start:5781 stop:6317 length:537 start_codon:yes stop_codon:yes gene_type:complete
MTKFNDGEDIHIYQEKYVEAKATEGNPVHIVQDFESEAKADILDHEADKAEDRELAAKLEQLSDIPFAEDPSIPEMDEFFGEIYGKPDQNDRANETDDIVLLKAYKELIAIIAREEERPIDRQHLRIGDSDKIQEAADILNEILTWEPSDEEIKSASDGKTLEEMHSEARREKEIRNG